MMPYRFAVFPDIFNDPHTPNISPDDYPAWCAKLGEAIDIMDELTQETGVEHFIMERIIAAEPPDPIPLHEYNGVRPGVDFPATLG